MNGPRRLLDGDASDFERNLLRTARSMRPTAQARRRTVKAVVAGIGAIGTAAGGGSSVMAGVGISALLKWGSAGVLATALAVAGAQRLEQPLAPPASAAAPAVRAAGRVVERAARETIPPATPPSTPEASTADATIPEPSVMMATAPTPRPKGELTGRTSHRRGERPDDDDKASASAPVTAQAPPSSPAAPRESTTFPSSAGALAGTDTPAPAPAREASPGLFAGPSGAPAAAAQAKSLADEVAALDRARQALEAKDPNAALRVLEDRQRRHGAGRMAPEATLLRIRALVRKGDHAGAEAVARAYFASDPNGPYAARIRAALAAAKKSSAGE
jgi:hypothetical protein